MLISFDKLLHEWSVPTDALSTEKMVLDKIQHHASEALATPAIDFDYTMLNNRVNYSASLASMSIPRLETIKTELGGEVTFAYGQPNDREPSSAVAPSHDCFTGDANLDPNGYVRTGCYFFQAFFKTETDFAPIFFNKYVVTSLTENAGLATFGEGVTKTFKYETRPAWAYAEQWGFTKTDLGSGTSSRHCQFGYGCNLWSDYRGHSEVTVSDANGMETLHFFYTGMAGDRAWTDDATPLSASTRSGHPNSEVLSDLPRGGSWWNFSENAGTTLGTQTILPSGYIVSYDEIAHNWVLDTSYTPASWPPVYFKTSTVHLRERRDPVTGQQRGTRSNEFYDSLGRLYRVADLGLIFTAPSETLPDDDVTTCLLYPTANAAAINGSWIVGAAAKTAVVEGLNETCVNTNATFPGSGDWIAGNVTRFDNSAVNGALPARGNATDTFTFEKQDLALLDWSGATMTYNARGQVLDTTERHSGAVTKTRYGDFALLTSIDGPISGVGDKTVFENDARWGAQTKITIKNAEEDGNAALVTSLVYDDFGRLESVTLPGDSLASTKFTYMIDGASNNASYVKTEVLREIGAPSYEYLASYSLVDGFGRQVQSQMQDTENGGYILSSSYYGDVGEQKRHDNPSSVTLASTPGALHAPSITNGYQTTTINAGARIVTSKTFDSAGVEHSATSVQTLGLTTKTTTTADSVSRISTSTTDIRGNVVETVVPAHDGTATTTFTYNARNEVTTIDGPGASDTIVYDYGSDWSTRLVSLVDPDLTNPGSLDLDERSIGYQYDLAGRLVTQNDGNGNQLWIGYTAASQPVELRKDSSSGALVAEWDYDNTGRSTTSTNYNLTTSGTSEGIVVTSSTYESIRGQRGSSTWSIPGLLGPKTISRTFDTEGRPDTVTYPDGSVSDIDYDLMGRQDTLSHDGTMLASGAGFNARGQLTGFNAGSYAQTGDANAAFQFGYTPWSGLLESRSADAATATGTTNLAAFTYEWLDGGNLRGFVDQSGGGWEWQCFDYDAADQLKNGYTTTGTCASGAHDTGTDPYEVTYTYSNNGNIATANGDGTVNGSYAYGGGKPHAVTSAGGNSYGYDSGGNQTSRTIAGATSSLAYDVQNRLIGISGAGADMDALYDAGGNRVKRTLDGEVTYYLGDAYEFQPAAVNPLASSAGGTTTTTAPVTTTTTAPATTTTTAGGPTTTAATTTTTAGGGTKTVTVRATSWWNTAEFELHVNGVATDGRRAVTTSGGTYSLYTFQVPLGTSINDLRIDFDDSPNADLGVSYVEIDGEQYHTWLTTVEKLGNYNEGCGNVTFAAVTALSCAGYFDFSAVVPTGTTTTTVPATTTTTAPATTTTTVPATTTTVPATSTTVGGTKTVTVRATAWWNVPEFELHVNGVATDGRRVVTTSGGTYSLYSFEVPLGTSINDLRIDFDHSPAADIGVDYIEIDGEQYHMWLGTVEKLGNYNEGCGNVTFAAVTALSCAGYFDFGAVVPTGTTTTTAGGATTTTVLGTTTTTAGGTTSTTTPAGGGAGGGGAVSVVRVHHSFNGQSIGTTINGEFVLSVTDHLGSASVNREAGGETSVQQYTPFGAVRGGTGGLLNDWTFTGQTDDPGTGLVDYNARHYDPQLGRFVMADTVLAGLNRYTYVHNNPLKYVDQSGHLPGQNPHTWTQERRALALKYDTDLDLGIRAMLEGDILQEREMYAHSVYLETVEGSAAIEFALDLIFDMSACRGDESSATSCGIEIALALPWGKAFKALKLAAAAASAADTAHDVERTVEAIDTVGDVGKKGDDALGIFCSFSAETRVLMASGESRPISEVRVGDLVLALDPETGERGPRRVMHLWIHADTLVDLRIDGFDLATTTDHPFWNHTDGEWQRASDLDPGDFLLSEDGDLLAVDGFNWASARTATAYNLNVKDTHTYFVEVGTDPVLVHNAGGVFQCGETLYTKNGAFNPTAHSVAEAANDNIVLEEIVDALSVEDASNIIVDSKNGVTKYLDPESGITVVTDTFSENIITMWRN